MVQQTWPLDADPAGHNPEPSFSTLQSANLYCCPRCGVVSATHALVSLVGSLWITLTTDSLRLSSSRYLVLCSPGPSALKRPPRVPFLKLSPALVTATSILTVLGSLLSSKVHDKAWIQGLGRRFSG